MPTIQTMQAQLSNLDTYTQLSVLGSWAFTANAAAINAAMKYIPDAPVDNGIEQFTQYEAARRSLIAEADKSYVPAFIALSRDLAGSIYEADGQARDLDSTLQFMMERAPVRSTFEAEYDNRVRLGMKPGMSKKQFADFEFERAMKAHNELVAKGEHAVRLCDTITIADDRGYSDLPDWVAESFYNKFIEKLHNRWEKLEMTRTNPRRRKEIRDSAAADQKLIERTLHEYDETPGFAPDNSSDKSFDSAAGDISAIGKQDPKAPGVVTITKYVTA